MRKIILLVALLVLAAVSAYAFGGPAPKREIKAVKEGVYLIDDFESGNLRSPREWWTFDLSKAEAGPNKTLTEGDDTVRAEIGKYSLHLKGEVKNWYAGGCGSYIAKETQDLSGYNFLQLDIYGRGEGSGTLKIELFDDDNNNWQVEQDPARNYANVYDDKFIYDVRVDWDGWERVTIPLDDFVDDNPGVGDGVWNPQQIEDSGGLLQIQFICLGAAEEGSINFNIDNISLTVSEE